MKRSVIVVLSLSLLAGCSEYEEYQLANKCKKLIVEDLVAPSSAEFHNYKIHRNIKSKFRMPDGLYGNLIQEELDQIKVDIEIAKISEDKAQVTELMSKLKDVLRRINEDKRLLSIQESKPWAEIYWELDSQNRSGATLRLLGVCTFEDNGNKSIAGSTFELSSLDEGRIPKDAPENFSNKKSN